MPEAGGGFFSATSAIRLDQLTVVGYWRGRGTPQSQYERVVLATGRVASASTSRPLGSEYYGTRFGTVEIDGVLSPSSEHAVATWRDSVPDDFVFAVKAAGSSRTLVGSKASVRRGDLSRAHVRPRREARRCAVAATTEPARRHRAAIALSAPAAKGRRAEGPSGQEPPEACRGVPARIVALRRGLRRPRGVWCRSRSRE
jgi:hypothetical protein